VKKKELFLINRVYLGIFTTLLICCCLPIFIMADSKIQVRKKYEENLKDSRASKAQAEEKQWVKGFQTSMEQDILAASKK